MITGSLGTGLYSVIDDNKDRKSDEYTAFVVPNINIVGSYKNFATIILGQSDNFKW